MSNKPSNRILGALPKGLAGNLAIVFFALMTQIVVGGPYIYIEQASANSAFLFLFGLYLSVTFWSIFVLAKHQMTRQLVAAAPYRWVRHPMYAAILWLLNPALAILLRSWILLFALIPAYIIWKSAIAAEEKFLAEKFGPAYEDYQKTVWPFFPNLAYISKILFYGLTGAAIFLAAFVVLNFSAVYLRWTFYEHQTKITYDDPSQKQPSPFYFQQMFESGGLGPLPAQADNNAVGTPAANYKPNYNVQPNLIIISKINIRAPLVAPASDSDKDLNRALNQGVIIYPGSVLPGQNGEILLSGHSSIYPWVFSKYGQVFTLLDKLSAGDTISLIYNNYQYDYRVTGKQILWPKDVRISSTSQPVLTLYTCWPIGTTLKRLVVTGELIQ